MHPPIAVAIPLHIIIVPIPNAAIGASAKKNTAPVVDMDCENIESTVARELDSAWLLIISDIDTIAAPYKNAAAGTSDSVSILGLNPAAAKNIPPNMLLMNKTFLVWNILCPRKAPIPYAIIPSP